MSLTEAPPPADTPSKRLAAQQVLPLRRPGRWIATALNMAPVHDVAAAVTLSADVSNVDTVIVDGVVRKRDGRLLADTGRARRLVEESRDRLLAAVAARKPDA